MSYTPCSCSHVVECCHTGQALRVRTLSEFLATNVRRFFGEARQEYFPLGFFESREAATEFLEERKRNWRREWSN